MRTKSLVIKRLLSPDTVSLSYLILDVHSPEQAFFKSNITLKPEEVVTVQQYNFSEILQRTSTSRLQGFLTSLLASSRFKASNLEQQISSVCNTTYQLKNSDQIFQRICSTEDAREWLESVIARGQDVYFVVGIQTMLDAELRESRYMGSERAVDVVVPALSIASAAAGVPLPSIDAADIGAGGSIGKSTIHTTQSTAPGEQIYALQYRKVEFSWVFSKKLDSMALQKGNRWKVYWHNRIANPAEEEEEDVVEAFLDGDLPPSIDATCIRIDGSDQDILLAFD